MTSNRPPDQENEVQNNEREFNSSKVLNYSKRFTKQIFIRNSLAVSLATVFIVALFVNQIQLTLVQKEKYLLAGEPQLNSNRIPANIPGNELKDIHKEMKVAEMLKNSNLQVRTANGTGPFDQFIYGTLKGKYRAQFSNGKIVQLQLAPHVGPLDGEIIQDKSHFFIENRELFVPSLKEVKLLTKGEGYEIFELFDSEGSLGQWRFLQDEEGRVSLVEKLSTQSN